MRRLALIAATALALAAGLAASATGDDSHTYFIELDNAFGLVEGSEVKVAGVSQGVVEQLHINEHKRAVLEVSLSGPLAQLGEQTICSSEPQSLIAEYFIDCAPRGDPLEEGTGSVSERVENPDIPVKQTRQTVQTDLVQSALRQPFKERLQMIISEFGTALAGNPENLNAAIRRGAPALTQLRQATRILGDQNRIIRDLNADSDEIIGRLEERRVDVRRFVEEARDTARAGAERREDLSRNFDRLDDFLAELGPTMAELNALAVEGTPLMRDLRATGPGLNTLAGNLPGFNSAATRSLTSLGDASRVGRRALRKGSDEIEQLGDSTRKAFPAADSLAKFLADIDDPRRNVAVDSRAARDSGRDAPTGYTGMEGLLNYAYYQTGAINQFDELSHLLHFSIFDLPGLPNSPVSTPCSEYNAQAEVPAQGGGTTTDFDQIHRCVAWLGENQPGINQPVDVPPYDPSVCPDGSTEPSICNPAGASAAGGSGSGGARAAAARDEGGSAGSGSGGAGTVGSAPDSDSDSGSGSDGSDGSDGAGDPSSGDPSGGLGDILGLPKLGAGAAGGDRAPQAGRGASQGGGASGSRATRDLLRFLFD